MILAEPRWLRRVLLNMLTNALKASPEHGSITLCSRVESGAWLVSLADQGKGLPTEYLEKIFERFFRLWSGKESDEAGSELGLAIRHTDDRLRPIERSLSRMT